VSIALCTDSSSQLTPTAAVELGVDVVDVPLTLGGHQWAGSIDVFYDRMRAGVVATTSQPSPGTFLEAFERAAAGGATSVVSLHLDRRVSGVALSAEIAAREASLPVLVVSLPTASYGVAMCVRAARASLAADASPTEAAAEAIRVAEALDNVFATRSAPGGRLVSSAPEWAVLRFGSAGAQTLSTHETAKDATAAMTRIVRFHAPALAAVGHAAAEVEGDADHLAHDLLDSVSTVERYRMTPSVGANTGPDAFGAFWWPSAR
jgi:fatty acid-binding protein DegV